MILLFMAGFQRYFVCILFVTVKIGGSQSFPYFWLPQQKNRAELSLKKIIHKVDVGEGQIQKENPRGKIPGSLNAARVFYGSERGSKYVLFSSLLGEDSQFD